ncbi:MAG TPA: DNA-directed RNA polymerase subunit P [Euryarchaeota archaeon]|nr:DNA-directed RNA polymerase subunit P [Euryarchaeota archaeon]HIQ10300.1 DNA-directed RNA polymerase subunit P [Euryarchaeota archaeon]
MTYLCPYCGNQFEDLPRLAIRCPYCGHRIILKARPAVVKVVKAR